MRKNLEAISLAALAVQFWITYRALYGPVPLPDRIPTHFDLAGNPNGWGSPAMLLLFPVLTAGIYLLITIVARFPAAFNYPVRVTAENRPRLQALALSMIVWLKMEIVCLFAWMQWATIQTARHAQPGLPVALMPVTLVAVFVTIVWHIAAMFKARRNPSGS
jgi:uncharacterized membrane protein